MSRLSSLLLALATWALQFRLWLRRGLLAASPGQGLVEYALILVLIAVTSIGIMSIMGQNLSTIWYSKIIGAFP